MGVPDEQGVSRTLRIAMIEIKRKFRSKEKSKLKYWSQYFDMAGMNMTIARNEKYGKLVRIGLPNQLRGEMWELNCGAIFERYSHQGEYQSILEANKGMNHIYTPYSCSITQAIPPCLPTRSKRILIGNIYKVTSEACPNIAI